MFKTKQSMHNNMPPGYDNQDERGYIPSEEHIEFQSNGCEEDE